MTTVPDQEIRAIIQQAESTIIPRLRGELQDGLIAVVGTLNNETTALVTSMLSEFDTKIRADMATVVTELRTTVKEQVAGMSDIRSAGDAIVQVIEAPKAAHVTEMEQIKAGCQSEFDKHKNVITQVATLA